MEEKLITEEELEKATAHLNSGATGRGAICILGRPTARKILARLKSAEDALRFYADKRHHTLSVTVSDLLKSDIKGSLDFDDGQTARAHFEKVSRVGGKD